MFGHDLVDHLFTLRPPKNDEVAELMEKMREYFIVLAHTIVDNVDESPDRTVAIRKLHAASQATITAIALNQEGY